MLALVYELRAAPASIRNCRVDVAIDSQVVIDTWRGEGSKTSSELTAATKDLFRVLTDHNLQLTLSHIPSRDNQADQPFRHVSPLPCLHKPGT